MLVNIKVNIDGLSPVLSVTVVVFNQREIIVNNLHCLARNSEEDIEILILEDCSDDNTLELLQEFVNDFDFNLYPNVKRIVLYRNRFSRFETWCEDFLIRSSISNTIILIQADMKIVTQGYDKRFFQGLEKNQDIFAISGRGIEPLEPVVTAFRKSLGSTVAYRDNLVLYAISILKSHFPKKAKKNNTELRPVKKENSNLISQRELEKIFIEQGHAGFVHDTSQSWNNLDLIGNSKLYVGQTIMRGPLAFRKNDYLKIGGFDTNSFFLGFDEHDLCLRALSKLKKRVAYLPMKYSSPLEHGSTRKKRTLRTELEILYFLIKISARRKHTSLWTIDLEKQQLRNIIIDN